MTERARGRWMLAAIAAIFLGPLVLAWWLYFDPTVWRPEGTVNHGELIQPVRTVPAARLVRLDGSGAEAVFDDAWSLIVVTRDGCGERCAEALYQTRQIHAGLGRRRERVRRVLIVDGRAPDPAFLSGEHPDLVALAPGAGSDAFIRALFEGAPAAGTDLEGAIFIGDPLRNLVMRHPPGSDPGGLREDLKRLLKLSRIG